MKKFFVTLLAAICAAAALIAGCMDIPASDGNAGRDGRDGDGITLFDVFESVNEEREKSGREKIDFSQFVSEYLDYESKSEKDDLQLKKCINASLFGSVSIIARFTYNYGQTAILKMFSGIVAEADAASGDAYVLTTSTAVYNSSRQGDGVSAIYVLAYGQDVNGVNYHVTGSNDIVDEGGYCINAEIAGVSLTYDIALIKITASDAVKRGMIKAVSFDLGESRCVGEKIFAVGNADGSGMGVAQGAISHESEDVRYISESGEIYNCRAMRVSAGITSGNLGGAVFNGEGKVSGMLLLRGEDDMENMAYAEPADLVYKVYLILKRGASSPYVQPGFYCFKWGFETYSESYQVYDEQTGELHIGERVKLSAAIIFSGNAIAKDSIITHVSATVPGGTEAFAMEVTSSHAFEECALSVEEGYAIRLTFLTPSGVEKSVSFVALCNKYSK